MRRGAFALVTTAAFVAGIAALAAACSAFSGSDASSGGGGTDGAAAADGEAPAEGGVMPGTEGGVDVGPVHYSDLNDTSKWRFFDVKSSHASSTGFDGAAYDRHGHVFFAPKDSDLLAILDLTQDFTQTAAWTIVDLGAMFGANGMHFTSVTVSGDYVYLVPGEGALALRYNTASNAPKAVFNWEAFALEGLNAGETVGFSGAVPMGNQIAFVPLSQGGGSASSLVIFYDTSRSFTDPSSWTSFDLSTVPNGASGPGGASGVYSGAAVTTGYLFFGAAPGGVEKFARFDRGAAPDAGFSVLTAADGKAGLQGSVLVDGTYVYFTPFNSNQRLTRLDPKQAIEGKAAWTYTQAPPGGNATYGGAVTDGRHLYTLPFKVSGKPGTVVSRTVMTAFPTDGGAASWEAVDLKAMNMLTGGFSGAVYDGKYVYFAPYLTTVIARFDARDPAEKLAGPPQSSSP